MKPTSLHSKRLDINFDSHLGALSNIQHLIVRRLINMGIVTSVGLDIKSGEVILCSVTDNNSVTREGFFHRSGGSLWNAYLSKGLDIKGKITSIFPAHNN